MPHDGLTASYAPCRHLNAPGIVTAWPRLAASDAAGRLGESHHRFFLRLWSSRARRPERTGPLKMLPSATVIKNVLAECRDDYVGLWSIVRRVQDDLDDQSTVVETTMALLRKILREDNIAAGNFQRHAGRDFQGYTADNLNEGGTDENTYTTSCSNVFDCTVFIYGI